MSSTLSSPLNLNPLTPLTSSPDLAAHSSRTYDLSLKLKACSFSAFDFETTGLSAVRDRIVEIGAVRFTPGNTQLQRYQQLINPQMPMPEAVIDIHGITDSEVASAPDFSTIAAEFQGFLEDSILLAHHAAFDVAFYTCELRRAGIDPQSVLVLDTYHLARKMFPEAPSYKLGNLVTQFGIDMEGAAHRALPDALACARLFEVCIAALPEGTETTLEELIKRYPQCRVGMNDLDPAGHPAQGSLRTAISNQQDVMIEYRNARNEVLQRRISPILMGGYGRYSYVEAYCHLRQENRQFRIDRIQRVSEALPVAG